MNWTSVFRQTFDTVIVGTGYSGVAAALALRARGERVLMTGPRGDLLWESGRAFWPEAGTSTASNWAELASSIAALGGAHDSWFDGALAEVAATRLVADAGVDLLYFARPVQAERVDGIVSAVLFATKSGVLRVRARRWIDASEQGELLRLVDPGAVIPEPLERWAQVYLQHPSWPAETQLESTAWPTERVLRIPVPAGPAWRGAIDRPLGRVGDGLGETAAALCASHLSFEPYPLYAAPLSDAAPLRTEAGNLAVAHAAQDGSRTLAARFELGLQAAQRVASLPSAGEWVRPSRVELPPALEHTVDVAVVGVGTGGVIAALAASRAGASVLGVDVMPFVGGIGTGGGVHAYWFGAPGGLQSELDRRTHEQMKRFGGGAFRDGPFNPWAKLWAAEAMLQEDQVDLLLDAIVFDAERKGDRVTAVLVATPSGIVRIRATAFIDGTGDGDLLSFAGAEFVIGRVGDQLLHAYSQSSGLLRKVRGELRMDVVNFDAGYCDSTDVEDLTRARVDGILLYHLDRAYENDERPTYIAPILGLRQGRQAVTDLRLSLDDMIRRRRFPDAIGYTASHMDSHGTDFEFDTDEAVFWQWGNRAFGLAIGSEVSFRMLLPLGLANVVIASRCLGVEQDAHYGLRMQRDIQRVGEAAGYAAALAVPLGGELRGIPVARLQELLTATDALGTPPRSVERGFGVQHRTEDAPAEVTPFDATAAITDELFASALAQLDAGMPGEAIWWLARNPQLSREAVLERLEGEDDAASWLAAGIMASWADRAAEPRLLRAVITREYGFGVEGMGLPNKTGAFVPKTAEPLTWHKLVPNWLTAIAMLRMCGTAATLPVLRDVALQSREVGLSTATTILLTMERLIARGELGAADRDEVLELVTRLSELPMLGTFDYTARAAGYYAEQARRGAADIVDYPTLSGMRSARAQQTRNMFVDMSWQPPLVADRIRIVLGEKAMSTAKFATDPRGFVRRAFGVAAACEEERVAWS